MAKVGLTEFGRPT